MRTPSTPAPRAVSHGDPTLSADPVDTETLHKMPREGSVDPNGEPLGPLPAVGTVAAWLRADPKWKNRQT